MRRLVLGILVLSCVWVLILASEPKFERATISGTVKSSTGGGLSGVLVRLINTDRSISVSVLSQAGGLYYADVLFPGSYEIRAERKGYQSAVKSGVRAKGHISVDLVVRKVADEDTYLSSEHVFDQFPEDPDKNLVVDTCFRCHSMLSFLKERKSHDQWETLVKRMVPRRRDGMTEDEINRVIGYFDRYFNESVPLGKSFQDAPEAPPNAMPVRITEYSIPDQPPPEVSIPSTNTAPMYPHNIIVTPQGMVWFALYKSNRVASLDPTTGEFRSYPVPTPGSVPHGITYSKRDGSIWFTESRGNKIGRLDPKTGEIIEMANFGGNTIVEDSKGNMYTTLYLTNQIGKVNTQTHEYSAYDLKTPKAMPYGIVVDQKDQVWWCQLFADSIGKLDPETGEIREYPTPTKLSGPRRLSVDQSGNIWFTEWLANKVGKLDPVTGKIEEYDLPTPSSEAYEVRVDAENTVWVAGYLSNTLSRFDRAKKMFVGYPIPTPRAEIRKMAADPERGVWFAQSHTDVIGHIHVKR